jgi:outer membrane protein TolC
MRNLLLIIIFFSGSLNAQSDLSIQQAVEKSLENNFQIKLVASNVQVAELQNTWANAGIVPTFSLNVGNSTNLSDNTNNPASFFPGVVLNDNLQATVDMAWTVFNGFGIRINKQRFEQLEAQTKGNAMVVVESTVYDVIMAYYTALVQKRKLTLMKSLLQFSKDKLAYFQIKNEFGTSTSLDLLQFENQVYTDSTNYLMQELSFKNALRNLNLVMAEGVEAEYNLTDEFNVSVPDIDYKQLEESMVSSNLNLKNQYFNQQLQSLNIDAQKTAYYPVLSLNLGVTPSAGYIKLFGDNGFSATTNSASLYAQVNLRYTLFNGFTRKRNVEIAKLQFENSEMQTQELKLNLTHQLRGIFEMYQMQSNVELMAVNRVENAQKTWALGKEKYDLGLINIFNLNDIKLSYQQSVLNYYDRVFDLLKTHYDLLRITGQISQEYTSVEE